MRKGEKKEYQLKPARVYQTWQSLDWKIRKKERFYYVI